MRKRIVGDCTVVSVSPREIYNFALTWPCSGMRNAVRNMTFTFDPEGDLVNIEGQRRFYDESAVRALCEDAKAFSEGKCTTQS